MLAPQNVAYKTNDHSTVLELLPHCSSTAADSANEGVIQDRPKRAPLDWDLVATHNSAKDDACIVILKVAFAIRVQVQHSWLDLTYLMNVTI